MERRGERGARDESARRRSSRLLLSVTVGFALFLVALVGVANSGIATRQLLELVSRIPGRDKTAHFALMGTMAFLLNLSLGGARWRLGPLAIAKGSVLVAIVVTLEEFSQRYVAVRSFSLEDLAYDYLGIAALGQLAVWICDWRAAQRGA